MSLSARVPVNVDTYKYIPEIFTNKVIDAAKKNLVAVDAVNTEWLSGQSKGDTFYLPKTNVVAATEVTVNSKASSTDPFATAHATVTMNQWFEAPVDIDDMTKFQSQVDMEDHAVKEAAYAIRLIIDTYICTLFSSLGGYSTSAYGSDGQTLSDDLLLYLTETLNEADVPYDNRSLIVDPSGLTDMLKIDKLVSADYIRRVGNIENGIIGNSAYGCVVRVTNNLVAVSTGSYGCLLHRDAIAAKIQIQKSWVKKFEELHTTRYQAEALWGASEAQDTFAVPFYTRKL